MFISVKCKIKQSTTRDLLYFLNWSWTSKLHCCTTLREMAMHRDKGKMQSNTKFVFSLYCEKSVWNWPCVQNCFGVYLHLVEGNWSDAKVHKGWPQHFCLWLPRWTHDSASYDCFGYCVRHGRPHNKLPCQESHYSRNKNTIK